MNKELILKYKTEFDHWLNGGKLLAYYTLLPDWTEVDTEDHWRIPDINNSAKFVINDQYIEFRKALAEGKTVQFDSDIATSHWTNLALPIFYPSYRYRIKPDEPKFKVGDWVLVYYSNGIEHNLFNLKCIEYVTDEAIEYHNGAGVTYFKNNHRVELWKPQPDEYCWFYNEDTGVPIFDYFSHIEDGKFHSEHTYSCNQDDATTPWDYCEPFIGQLPIRPKD